MNAISDVFITNLPAQLPEVSPDTIVSRTLFTSPRMKAVLFGFAPGQELSEHTAATPAVIHILDGEATLTLGGAVHAAGAGTWVHLPARLRTAEYDAETIAAPSNVIPFTRAQREGKL